MTTTTITPAEAPPKQSWLRRAFGKQPIGWLFVAPYVLFLVGIYLGPLVLQFWISFRDFFFSAPGVDVETPFIGLGNYVDALTDPTFLSSLWHSVIFLVINVPITVVGSLVLAYALNAKIRGLTFFRTSYYVPYVTASVSVIAVWLFLFSSDGLVNQLLGQFAPDPSWLINKYLVMPMIAIFVAWKQMGYFILLYLAALQNVSKETYEAADLDGCTGFQKFRYVTVPAVRPATVLVVILATTTGMNLFTEPYLLTNGGGPNGASITPVFYIYQKGVEQGEAGFAAAMGMILILITFLIAMIQRQSWSVTDTSTAAVPPEAMANQLEPAIVPSKEKRDGGWVRYILLGLGALIFLFPFYYMVVGSFQTKADKTPRGIFPEAGNVTVNNYVQINESINISQGLLNSTVFTIGVLLCTLVFGLLAGWSLALLEFRGKGSVFSGMLLLLVVSFQLLLVPLYVLIVRYYGLADSYLGMILPFAINTTAVFIFRQFFLQIPKDLFEAARIDGAGELLLLWKIGIPMARPAILSAALITFIGPWNEFMWPFLITKEQQLQPFAVSLSNYMNNIAGRADNPDGSELAGGVVLALPVVLLFVIFQKHFTSTDASSGVKG